MAIRDMTNSHLSNSSNDSPRSRSTCRERLITGVLLTLAVSVTTPLYSTNRFSTSQRLQANEVSLGKKSHLTAQLRTGLCHPLNASIKVAGDRHCPRSTEWDDASLVPAEFWSFDLPSHNDPESQATVD
jgi:hypothetical protein